MLNPWDDTTHCADPNITHVISVHDPTGEYGAGVLAWVTNEFSAYRIRQEVLTKTSNQAYVRIDQCNNVDEFLSSQQHRTLMSDALGINI